MHVHFPVQTSVFVEGDPLLQNDFLQLFSGHFVALTFHGGRANGKHFLFFVTAIDLEVEVGGHAHRPGVLALAWTQLLQVENVFVAAVRHILPRLGLEKGEVERTFVFVEALLEDRVSLPLRDHFVAWVVELALDLLLLTRGVLASDGLPTGATFGRCEHQVPGLFNFLEHLDAVLLLIARLDVRVPDLESVKIRVVFVQAGV